MASSITSTSPSDPTNPIDSNRFALAMRDLPLDAIHSKAAEISNSIAHLRHSNAQMLPFADEGDQDCKEAMFENLTVIGRMNERMGLLKAEVEGRGLPFTAEEEDEGGLAGATMNGTVGVAVNGEVSEPRAPSGRLTDEELRRQVEAQMGGADEEEEEKEEEAGVHL